MRRRVARSAFILLVLIAAVALPGAAVAAPPSNDNFAGAIVIDPSQPYSDVVTISEAGTEPGEPQVCNYAYHSVWYAITPTTNGVLRLSTLGSNLYDTELDVYRQIGSGLGGLSFLNCGAYGGSSFSVEVQAGATYYIQASNVWSAGGSIQLNAELVPPPPNDDFAKATAIGALPFSDTIDTTTATVQPNEPTPSCGYGLPAGSAWYAFTSSAAGSYSASTQYGNFTSQVAAYTGDSLSSLSQVGCRFSGNLLTFHLDAGQTVYLQVGGVYSGYRGSLTLNFSVAPDPVVQPNISPTDPSIFESVQFCDYSYDPAGVGIESRSWNFGDGASSTDQCVLHRYASDDTYTVTLTVKTPDGRSKSLSRDVVVKTHDVSIAKVGVPQTGTVGQSRQITVGVTNNRYAETVQVVLLKSIAGGGWQQVGMLTQYVPLRGPSRTTNFAFSYTFAPEDAVLGKITFQAVAVIKGARDAISTDNSYISLSTKVNG
jgi:PKD repeat protein